MDINNIAGVRENEDFPEDEGEKWILENLITGFLKKMFSNLKPTCVSFFKFSLY